MDRTSYKNLFSLTGKTALVTGGSGMLGREIVKGLRDFGATVYLADIDKNTAADLIDNAGIRYLDLDMTSPDSVAAAVKSIVDASGRIDIMVNSAYPRTADWGRKF